MSDRAAIMKAIFAEWEGPRFCGAVGFEEFRLDTGRMTRAESKIGMQPEKCHKKKLEKKMAQESEKGIKNKIANRDGKNCQHHHHHHHRHYRKKIYYSQRRLL